LGLIVLDHNDFTERKDVAAPRSRRSDPLARVIVWDLLCTTAGFLLIVTAIVFAVEMLQ
jgi:hypothetical protein